MSDEENKPILKYIWHTNSPNSCEACRENAGKEYFSANDIPPLPVHPNCHCWVEPIYLDCDNCPYNVKEEDVKEGEDMLEKIDNYLNEVASVLSSETESAIETAKKLLQQTKALITAAYNMAKFQWFNTEKKTDKYYHCKTSCQGAQLGNYGEKFMEELGHKKEQYDDWCNTTWLKGRWSCKSSSSDPEDEKANEEGRNRGRNNPNDNCGDLCNNIDILFKK